jgi:hypothetical protein
MGILPAQPVILVTLHQPAIKVNAETLALPWEEVPGIVKYKVRRRFL